MTAGDPYRSSGGTPCPRCDEALVRETDDELRCANGCGTWLGNKLLDKLAPPGVVAKSSGNPFRATPLPPTRCLVCTQPLNDLYKGAVDVITIGQCLAHGIWLEGADRAAFEAMFRTEISINNAVATLPAPDPERGLEERVIALEAKVVALERALRDLLAGPRSG